MSPSDSTLARLQQRLRRQEKNANVWRRTALCAGAIVALAFIGWAPLTDTNKDNAAEGGSLTDTFKDAESLNKGDQPAGGDVDYIPTRLEWLAMQANVMMRVDELSERGYMIHFKPGPPKSDTILVVATYDADHADRDRMNREVQIARRAVRAVGEQRGWGSWLKVREEMKSRGQ